MVDIMSRKCRTESCGKMPSFGVAGTKTAEYCVQHAPDGMIDVMIRQCRVEGCGKYPSSGVASAETVKYCTQHAPDGMVDMKGKKEGQNRRLRQEAIVQSGRSESPRSTLPSTRRKGWSTSRAESAKLKAVARNRRSE